MGEYATAERPQAGKLAALPSTLTSTYLYKLTAVLINEYHEGIIRNAYLTHPRHQTGYGVQNEDRDSNTKDDARVKTGAYINLGRAERKPTSLSNLYSANTMKA